MKDTKRKFSNRGLTHSTAHHLLAVSQLIEQQGYARVSDIARRLGITRGSVSVTMQTLCSSGHVRQDENHFFSLTAPGRKTAASVTARHEIVERVLREVLDMSPTQAHRESCRMEYLIEAETSRRLLGLLRFWQKHNLTGTLADELREGCPGCERYTQQECPCCELECVSDKCEQQVEPIA